MAKESGRNTYAKIKSGINEEDTLKQEKVQASIAAYDLLCCHPKDVRMKYVKMISEASSSGRVSQILKEVRDIMCEL